MPPVLAAIGSAIAAYVTVQMVVMWIIAAAIGSWQASRARKAAKDAFNASLRDRLVSIATTTAYRSRVYGIVRNTDGVLFKAAHGPDSRYYTFVVATAGHEIDGFVQAYFSDTPVDLDANGYVQNEPFALSSNVSTSEIVHVVGGAGTFTLARTPIAGSVWSGRGMSVTSVNGRIITVAAESDGDWQVGYQYSSGTSMARVLFFTGTATQDLSSYLVALGIPNITPGAHRFAGIACMLITLSYSQAAFSSGVPMFSATMRGARCRDRRTGLIAFTQNPAVIADDWAQYVEGGNLAANEIAEDLMIASANACDVSHAFVFQKPGQAAQTLTMPMYQCGIVCRTEADPSETLAAIVESMAGQWGWAGGKLRVKAGFYSAPVATVDDNWFSDKGSREFNSGLPQNELVNIYKPEIADRDQNYTVVPVAPVRAEAYITDDRRELPVTLALEGVTDVLHAQHVCGVMLRHSRQGFTASIPSNFLALQIELFDTVALNLARFGLGMKTMEVASWSFSQGSGCTVLMREVSAGIFDPDAGFALLDEAPNTLLPLPWKVPQITGLAVTSGTTELTDASIVTRTRATWDAVPSESVKESGHIEVAYVLIPNVATTAIGEWATHVVAGSATEDILLGLMANVSYVFKVRAVNTLGVPGLWSVQKSVFISSTLMVVPPGPQGPAGLQGPPGANGLPSYFHVAYADNATGSLNFNQYVGEYIGTYVDFTLADSADYLAYTWVRVLGDQGPAGSQGIPGVGTDGRTSYLHLKYSDDGGATFTSAGGETVGKYLGQYVDFVLNDSALVGAYTWALIRGADGPLGPQGTQGPAGSDGRASYFHVAYASSANGAVGFNQNGGPYIGTYVDFTPADDSNYLAYTWIRVTGDQGPQGTQGIPGVGVDGRTSYLHLKYSDDGGVTLTASAGEVVGKYLGQYVDFTVGDSMSVSAYTWALIRGADGLQGPQGSQGTPGPAGGNVTLIARGGVTLPTPDSAVQSNAAAAWDGDVYSLESFAGGAYLTFQPMAATTDAVVGLNADPTTDRTYAGLDYAIQLIGSSGGLLYFRESGAYGALAATFTPNTVCSITYDGAFVRYFADSVKLREVAAPPGMRFYLDSSFMPGSGVKNIRFGPMGAAGTPGSNGAPGAAGAAGATSYFHVAYASSADGSLGFNQTGGPYIGTYVDFTPADSANHTAYTWVQMKGADGAAGTNGIAGTNGTNGQTSYLHIKYSNDGGGTFTANAGEDAGSWIGTYVDLTLADSGAVGSYTWAAIIAPTFRQEAQPVGSPSQGSIWLVPSTGRQYVYVGTTWWPTVGTGSINTAELTPGAVTVPISAALSADAMNPNTVAENTLLTVGSVNSGNQPIVVIGALDVYIVADVGNVTYTLRVRVGGVAVFTTELVGAFQGISTVVVPVSVTAASPGYGALLVIVTVQANHVDPTTGRLYLQTRGGVSAKNGTAGTSMVAMGLKR